MWGMWGMWGTFAKSVEFLSHNRRILPHCPSFFIMLWGILRKRQIIIIIIFYIGIFVIISIKTNTPRTRSVYHNLYVKMPSVSFGKLAASRHPRKHRLRIEVALLQYRVKTIFKDINISVFYCPPTFRTLVGEVRIISYNFLA